MKPIVLALALLAVLLAGCVTQATPPTPTFTPTTNSTTPTASPTKGAAATPSISMAPGEVEVPFETLARSEEGGGPDFYQPELILLTSLDEATDWKDQMAPVLWEQLQQVDFERYAVIAVFRGFSPTSNYPVTIDRITRQANRLIVHVQFWYPNPYWASTTAETRPYHLVKVLKDVLPPGKIELVFQAILLTPTPPTP